jgi:hypothetical protein
MILSDSCRSTLCGVEWASNIAKHLAEYYI